MAFVEHYSEKQVEYKGAKYGTVKDLFTGLSGETSTDPAWLEGLANAVQFLEDKQDTFRLLGNQEVVTKYVAWYKTTVEKEMAAGPQPFNPYATRLTDFGGDKHVPDFDQITPPKFVGKKFVFYLQDDYTKLAYFGTVDGDDGFKVNYEPMDIL